MPGGEIEVVEEGICSRMEHPPCPNWVIGAAIDWAVDREVSS